MNPAEIRAVADALRESLAIDLTRVAYSVDESAKLVGCGRDLLYGEINAGRLRSWREGRRRFVNREDLEAWARMRAAGAAVVE